MIRLVPIALVFAALAACETGPENPVERLNERLLSGEVALTHDGSIRGYLMSLLGALTIDPGTQMLVFSKTSLQMDQISPSNPRALYFNDEVSVGYVPHGPLLELATFDAAEGVLFYTLDAHPGASPKLVRKNFECASCHSSAPYAAMVVESVYPQEDGTPFISLGTIMPKPVSHLTPFEDRWGGWYVTGTHGSMRHMGNGLPEHFSRPFDLKGEQNTARLPARVTAANYPVASSDIVALMTFEHQMYVTNLIARVNRVERGKASPRDANLDQSVEELARALFFSGEAKLTSPVRGVSTFMETFPARGPRDSAGRSLRDFDLETRLFRYPFSYMVYSPLYDSLPEAIRRRLAGRIGEVLDGGGGDAYAHLSPDDRTAIRAILAETKPGVLGQR